MHQLVLTGQDLDIASLEAFLAAGSDARVEIAPEARAAVARCADFREHLSLGDTAYYGINTGFGRFARKRIDPAQGTQLQHNLLRSHATGMGPPLPSGIVRLMMVLRVNSLCEGFSGVSVELLDLIVAMVNEGIVPVVPSYGSVGASGDLAPLAHMSLPLIGEGEVEWRDHRVPAVEALREAGLAPRELLPKEGLALINGTQLMSAYAVRELVRLRRCLEASMCAAAMSLEAFEATDRIFDERLHALKRHPGQVEVARGFRRLLRDSEIIAGHRDCDRVQDPYSFRCIPQVLGAVRDTMSWVEEWVTREINAATDNPLLFPEDGEVLSGGNFHGEHMALALDALAIAAAEIASIAERRIDKLMDSDNDRLPRCLIANPGLNSGLMITQYLAAALVSENKVHAHPASVDTIPTSMGFEDHVSMGSISALKVARVVDNVARVVAVELLCGAQAIDFHAPAKPGLGTVAVHAAVRETVPFLESDTSTGAYLEQLERRVHDGSIVAGAMAAVGGLLGDAD
jgi:histidine ammonia-lyase